MPRDIYRPQTRSDGAGSGQEQGRGNEPAEIYISVEYSPMEIRTPLTGTPGICLHPWSRSLEDEQHLHIDPQYLPAADCACWRPWTAVL